MNSILTMHHKDQVLPQNVYDDASFFQGYKSLRQNDTGLNGALEVPALRQVLPKLNGAHVLDLGCGFGDFARYAREIGAASVIALDVSKKMLDEAKRLTNDRAVVYLHESIEHFIPEPNAFDLVVSSMALHYVANYPIIAERVFEASRPGGQFVFSVEHPVCTGNPIGWVRDADGTVLHWPLDNYQQEGARNTRWFIDGVIKYHRTTSTYVNTLVSAGFRLEHLGEPVPEPKALLTRPALEMELRRPPILLLAGSKPQATHLPEA